MVSLKEGCKIRCQILESRNYRKLNEAIWTCETTHTNGTLWVPHWYTIAIDRYEASLAPLYLDIR